MKRLMTFLFVLALSIGAGASLPVLDFGAFPNPGDDLQAALHLSFTVWSPPLADANWLTTQSRITPDDFQVAVFLSRQSGWTVPAIWNLRNRGTDWSAVAVRCGVPWDTIIVRPARDYGPPYGKAWGYWKKHGDARGFRLTDLEFVDMVRVHTLSRATGLTPDQVIVGMRGGKPYQKWAGQVYREKHGRGHGGQGNQGEHGKGQQEKQGQGKQDKQGQGHGNGHGKG